MRPSMRPRVSAEKPTLTSRDSPGLRRIGNSVGVKNVSSGELPRMALISSSFFLCLFVILTTSNFGIRS
jgi:hypothetical protein